MNTEKQRQREKKESFARWQFWAILLNPLWLAAYTTGMYFLAEVHPVEGWRGQDIVSVLCLAVCAVWVIVWVLLYLFREKKRAVQRASFYVLRTTAILEMIIFAGLTVFLGVRLNYRTNNFTNPWMWQGSAFLQSEKIVLEKNNLYKDGVDGILDALDQEIGLPDKMYVVNSFQVTYSPDGIISGIYAFLYGKDGSGNTRTYLIEYDSAKGEEMSVWIDTEVETTYSESKLLQPMLELLRRVDLREYTEEWGEENRCLLYYGKRAFDSGTSELWCVGEDSGSRRMSADEQADGYVISVYRQSPAGVETPKRFLCGGEIARQR